MKRKKPEEKLILKYWDRVGGTLVREFQMVPAIRKEGQGGRFLDGLIVSPGRPPKTPPLKWSNFIKEREGKDPFKGKNLLMVQAKAQKLGMGLMGQAFFSRILTRNSMREDEWKPNSLRWVILCKKSDPKLEVLCGYFGIDVVTPELFDREAAAYSTHPHA